MQVDVYLLDWNQRRPMDIAGALGSARSGRYEYSFSIEAPGADGPLAAAEHAYFRQGNNPVGTKVRRDRQSMSMWDVALVSGRAWLCVSVGFREVPELADLLQERVERSWSAWTDRPGDTSVGWAMHLDREAIAERLRTAERVVPETHDAWAALMARLQQALDHGTAREAIEDALWSVIVQQPDAPVVVHDLPVHDALDTLGFPQDPDDLAAWGDLERDRLAGN